MVAHKSDSDRLVQHCFFEPSGTKEKRGEEKIHLFEDVFKTAFLSGLPTDYKMNHRHASVKQVLKRIIILILEVFQLISNHKSG